MATRLLDLQMSRFNHELWRVATVLYSNNAKNQLRLQVPSYLSLQFLQMSYRDQVRGAWFVGAVIVGWLAVLVSW
jgi:hypothetical protein